MNEPLTAAHYRLIGAACVRYHRMLIDTLQTEQRMLPHLVDLIASDIAELETIIYKSQVRAANDT